MSQERSGKPVQQSFLDRLVLTNSPTLLDRAASIKYLKESVRRNLEWLLNTRRNPIEVPQNFAAVEASVYQYGLPDMTSFGLHSSKDRNRLLTILDSTIADFEPRLQNVKITLEEPNALTRTLRFTIHGHLRTDPAPERVSFDTILQLNSGQYQVS